MENSSTPEQFEAPDISSLAPLFPAYQLDHFIAQGGMGAVYQARQTSLDRPVAIKILPREFGQDASFRASFEAEAKAMAKLNHPNLIGIYDFGEVDGMLFLVMEFVNGKSLYHSSYGQAIDPTQAAEIVSSICRGLHHAHEAGILHRDVKPANILLTPGAVPKIGDFGLAQPMDAMGAESSEDEVIYGTPGYTAPEIIARSNVDHRADIFSIGVILHELVTGSLPDGTTVSPHFSDIIARATQPDPQQRFASADAMADALDQACATNIPALRQLAAAAPMPRTPQSSMAAPQKSKAGPVLAALLAAGAAAAAIVFFLAKEDPLPRKPAEQPAKEVAEQQPPADTQADTPTKPDKVPVVDVEPEPEPGQNKEDTIKALARLKAQLAAGDHSEFPAKTIPYGDHHLVLVPQSMSWQAAQTFAAAHGAHLAVLPKSSERAGLMQQLGVKKPAWLAAGKAARYAWQWMDGSPWENPASPKQLSQQESAISINSGGELVAQNPKSINAFILQWRKDGSNPCSLEAQLKRTKNDLASKGIDQAIYPVGTLTYNKSHFLLLDRQMSWENAHQFAKSYGAQLAVPSSAQELAWLAKTLSVSKTKFWLGGYMLDESSPWRWTTNESFQSSGWAAGEPSSNIANNKILASPQTAEDTRYWTSHDGTRGGATHILIEWSKPVKATSVAGFDVEKWLAGVNRKIADRVRPILDRHEDDRDDVLDKYRRDMKRAAKNVKLPGGRGAAARMQEYIESLVDQAMDDVEESGEIPEEIPKRAPEVFHNLTDQARKDVTKLDEDLDAALKKELDFYTRGLLKKATEITTSGFTRQANTIKQTVENIGESTDKFLETIGL